MKQKCEICGLNAESTRCFRHKNYKPLVRKPLPRAVNLAVLNIRKQDTGRMKTLFLVIWMKRLHVSEISGDYLGREPLSIYFHHILPKEKYPEAKHDEENIILLTLDEHSNVEINMYRYPEINRRRELLKTKYNL